MNLTTEQAARANAEIARREREDRAKATAQRRKASELRRQRAQLASACRNAVAAMGDALTLLEAGDTDGARVALQNTIDATRADLIGAKARR